jgi:hypothetical protein
VVVVARRRQGIHDTDDECGRRHDDGGDGDERAHHRAVHHSRPVDIGRRHDRHADNRGTDHGRGDD